MRCVLPLIAIVLALAGCGGGGGTGSTTNSNSAPTAVSVNAPAAVARSAWFTSTCTFADADGADDLRDLKFGIVATAYPRMIVCKYDNAANRLYVYDGTTWIPSGGVAPGANTTIEAPKGYLDCKNTTVSTTGNNVTVNFRMQLKPEVIPFTYTLGLSVVDVHGDSSGTGWVNLGEITVQ